MHDKSRLYISIGSMCDYAKIFEKILPIYKIKLLDFVRMPLKEFELHDIDFYVKLSEEGKLRIFKSDNKWYREDYFFELSLK